MPQPRNSPRNSRRAALAERKDQNQTQQKLLFAIIGVVVLFAIAIGIALTKGDKNPITPATMAPAAATTSGSAAAKAPTPSSVTPTESDPMRARVNDILRAIQEGDQDAIAKNVSFPRWHDMLVATGKESKHWNELDPVTQTLARQKITESLSADEPTRDFMRQSKVRSFVVMSQDAKRMKVQVILQHLIDTKKEQERTIELENIDGSWFLASMVASAIQTPEQMQEVGKSERAAERSRRQGRDMAPIEKQEFLADTAADVRSKIEGLCAKLTDLSMTKEISKAKRELGDFGKPAIPGVLNVIVGHEKLETHDDQMIINNAVSVLKDITQEDLGYAPGGIGGTMMGDIKKENVEALMRWFGWWRDNKTKWNGPKPPAEEK